MERKRLSSPKPSGNGLLSEEVIDRFVKYTRKGLPADGVCDLLSINRSTFWAWITKGQKYLDGDGQPEDWEIYARFVQAYRKATAEYRLDLHERLELSGPGEWQKYATILERRDRKTYGKTDPFGGSDEVLDPDERFL